METLGAANTLWITNKLYIFLIPQPQDTAWGGWWGGVRILLSQCMCARLSCSAPWWGLLKSPGFKTLANFLNHNSFFPMLLFADLKGQNMIEIMKQLTIEGGNTLLKVTDFLANGKDSLTDFQGKINVYFFTLMCSLHVQLLQCGLLSPK